MIIRGGENIYPAEIEQFLHTHPKVHEAQVGNVNHYSVIPLFIMHIKSGNVSVHTGDRSEG